MIAEILLVLAGHSSSLFVNDHTTVHPAFADILHPGEKECLETLGRIASRYRIIKDISAKLSRSPSRYVCALCATLNQILKNEYETLVVNTEARILNRDPNLVASGSFVPLSSVLATFAEWDTPLASLTCLVEELEARPSWQPGSLIDLLLTRSRTGVHRIADIISRLSVAVQRVWRTQLTAFIVHGSLSPVDPLASDNFALLEGSMPSCVSMQSRDSIAYIGRAVGTVKAARWQKQLPRNLASEHTSMLNDVLPEDQHNFDRIVAQIRTNVSEWLWLNVLTWKDVEEAVDSLANYFLLRNGEFSLSVIREVERLKISRLTSRAGPSLLIREQDLNLALLRASLGTTAQHDPSLSRLRISLPSGPLRPLLPSLQNTKPKNSSLSFIHTELTSFDDLLLGTHMVLTYNVTWPLDLFLHPSDLQIYSAIFGYLSSLRKTHTRIHTCWTSLSNAQRARRRWTGLDEGGTADLEGRKRLLRCGWGVVRDMGWFLDTLLGYVMTDVIDTEFRVLKEQLGQSVRVTGDEDKGASTTSQDDDSHRSALAQAKETTSKDSLKNSGSHARLLTSGHLDFTTLRRIHHTYLERLLTGCLLSSPTLTGIIRPILEVCERFAAQVERWGGDVLPALLFEGSLATGEEYHVGAMVQERWTVVQEINETLHVLLESFYDQLSLSTSQQSLTSMADSSKSIMFNLSMVNGPGFHHSGGRSGRHVKGLEGGGEVRRHVERLLLRLDFNGEFSRGRRRQNLASHTTDILKEGGLA